MLVEDAKRSILKVAHAKIIGDKKKMAGKLEDEDTRTAEKADEGREQDKEDKKGFGGGFLYEQSRKMREQQGRARQAMKERDSGIAENEEIKSNDYDVLLALGLTPSR